MVDVPRTGQILIEPSRGNNNQEGTRQQGRTRDGQDVPPFGRTVLATIDTTIGGVRIQATVLARATIRTEVVQTPIVISQQPLPNGTPQVGIEVTTIERRTELFCMRGNVQAPQDTGEVVFATPAGLPLIRIVAGPRTVVEATVKEPRSE